jgi:hypothetical protein
MNARTILTAFAHNRHLDPVICSPIVTAELANTYIGNERDLPQDDPAIIEARLEIGEACGFPPILKFELHALDFLVPETDVLAAAGARRTVRRRFNTRLGPLESITLEASDGAYPEKRLVESIDDVERLVWAYEHLADMQRFVEKTRTIMRQIGNRGLFCLNIGHPFFRLADAETLVYLAADHHERLHHAMERIVALSRRLINAAAAEGVICFFASQLSRHILSPAMITEWIVPPARELRSVCQRRRAVYYLHECGAMEGSIDNEFFHRIYPDWLEGFEQPPLGDITDLGAVRRLFPEDIVFKGNLNNEFVATAQPAHVERAALAMLESVKGYRHIVGAGCSLLRRTPVDNIRALTRATNRFLGIK